MSKGVGAFALKKSEDNNLIWYEYGSYNLNDPKYRNLDKICDGSITINKKCLVEPEMHKKIKRYPNGKKKLVTKVVSVDVDFYNMISDGLIEINNCSNCWEKYGSTGKIDAMAIHLLFKFFKIYQLNNEIPDSITYDI